MTRTCTWAGLWSVHSGLALAAEVSGKKSLNKVTHTKKKCSLILQLEVNIHFEAQYQAQRGGNSPILPAIRPIKPRAPGSVPWNSGPASLGKFPGGCRGSKFALAN